MLTIIYNHLIWYCCAIIVPSHLMGLLQKMRRDESAHPRSDDRSAGPIRLPDLRRSTAQHGAHGEKMGLDFKEKMGKREVYEGYVRNTCSNWFYMRTFLSMLTYLLSFLSKETSLRTILFFFGGGLEPQWPPPWDVQPRHLSVDQDVVQMRCQQTRPRPSLGRQDVRFQGPPRHNGEASLVPAWKPSQLCLLVGVTSTSICNIYIYIYIQICIYNICIYNIRTYIHHKSYSLQL